MPLRTALPLLTTVALLPAQDPYGRIELGMEETRRAADALGREPDNVLRDLASGDTALRRAAGTVLRELDAALQARLLRARLWSDEPEVALGAAVATPAWWLDSIEAERAVAVLTPRLFAEDAGIDIAEFAALLDADDVARLLADPAPLPRAHPRYVERLHRPMRPEHLPLLAQLAISDDALAREGALSSMRVVAELTDRYRENVASTVLTWPGGLPMRLRFDAARDRDPVTPRSFDLPEPTGGFPPLLSLALRRVFVVPADEAIEGFGKWAWRWASDARAAPGDLPLVEVLAKRGDLARRVAARAAADIGALSVLRSLRKDGEPMVRALATCGLARAGDAGALGDLEAGHRADPSTLAAWLEADTAAAIRALERAFAADDADRVAELLAAAMESARLAPFRIPPDFGAVLADRLAQDVVPGRMLAAVADVLPGARTRALAEAWFDRFDADSIDSPALDLLEVHDPDTLRARLRSQAREPAARNAALDALLALGDPASADELLEHVRALEEGQVEPTWTAGLPPLLALARTRAPAVEAHLRAVLDGPPTWRAFTALAAIELQRGVDPVLAGALLDDLTAYEGRAEDAWPALRDAAAHGDAGGVVLAWLEGRPLEAGPLDGLGSLDTAPSRAWLHRAVDAREHGLVWWATGELALAGDPAALDEVERVRERGWYDRIDDADPRVLTDGLDPATLGRWIRGLATNCCGAVAARRALEAVVGPRVVAALTDEGAHTPEQAAAVFLARFGDRLHASVLAGHLVVGPER